MTVFKIELTAKGKQHQRGSVFRSKHGEPLATLVVQTCEFGEVTGITYVNEARTSALVEYTQPCSFTPFAHAYDPYITEGLVWSSAKKYREALQKNAGTQKVRFQLYDDGWRIAS